MKLCAIFSAVLTVFTFCFIACAPPAGTPDGNDPVNPLEPETEETPPDPLDYGINLNAINKKDASMDGGSYADNPLLGCEWQPGANGGFTYFFKRDGTVSSTHHCELVFDNQFSYALYRNFLVTYGQEMSSGERLDVKTQ
jgi:hypothetical protein